jgi:glutathione peroxidase-family protein
MTLLFSSIIIDFKIKNQYNSYICKPDHIIKTNVAKFIFDHQNEAIQNFHPQLQPLKFCNDSINTKKIIIS